MAKHQLFLVHGMGGFEKNWSLGIQQLLRDAYKSYGIPATMGLDSDFQFVEVVYDDVFEDIRKLWKENAAAAATAFTQVGLQSSAVQKLLDLANGASRDDFFRTHVLDVVMFRFLKQINEKLSQSLRKQILDRLSAFPQNDTPAWSVIAHSLGTGVTHETLHAMFTQPVDGQMLGSRFKPDFLFMVANVSRVLWSRGGDIYASEVRPHSLETRGMCFKYCDYAHALDPFPAAKPFDRPPASWFPDGATQDALYEHVTLDAKDIQDVNVHGLSHYLSHPSVHISIFRTLLGAPEFITNKEETTALQKWRADRFSAAQLTRIAGLLNDLKIKDATDWTAIITSLFGLRMEVLKAGPSPEDGEMLDA